MLERPAFFISCEHGGNRVPAEYRHLFAGAKLELESHRGYDIGILPLAHACARKLNAPALISETSRLLVDLNRSEGHPRLFSEWTRGLPEHEQGQILARYYHPYRQQVRQKLGKLIASEGLVVHLSLHSFAPVLGGQVRPVDVGLLYDPARPGETELCDRWSKQLRTALPALRIRRNSPYRGISDGLVTLLRHEFPPHQYQGIEVEVNQSLPLGGGTPWQQLLRELPETLNELGE
jgi:predicted N-formylglutamate amidohydrolase